MTEPDDRHRPATDPGEPSRALRDFLARLAALVAADLAKSPADEPPRPDRVPPE